MHYLALATDYDGTIAADGVVDQPTLAALERLRDGSKPLILVTGRDLTNLQRVMPRQDIFDPVVPENGALLYDPSSHEVQAVGDAANRRSPCSAIRSPTRRHSLGLSTISV
jgi:HAD superfamily hydrolase (TIGR01484 family)